MLIQFRLLTVTARIHVTPGTHNPRISAQTVTIKRPRFVEEPYICFKRRFILPSTYILLSISLPTLFFWLNTI